MIETSFRKDVVGGWIAGNASETILFDVSLAHLSMEHGLITILAKQSQFFYQRCYRTWYGLRLIPPDEHF